MPTSNPVLVSNTHDLLTAIEELHEHGQFNGSSERFFSLIETCASKRPVSTNKNRHVMGFFLCETEALVYNVCQSATVSS